MRPTFMVVACIVVQSCGGRETPLNPRVDRPMDTPVPSNARGSLEVAVLVAGNRPDPRGYLVEVRPRDGGHVVKGVDSLGGTLTFSDLAVEANVVVRPLLVESRCFVNDPSYYPTVSIAAGQTTSITINVVCPNDIAVHDRITGHYISMIEFHGTLSERLVLHEDARAIRLQFFSGRFGNFEYVGTFARDKNDARRLTFSYGGSPSWSSVATIGENGCITLRHNTIMGMSDFEDGVYCPPPSK